MTNQNMPVREAERAFVRRVQDWVTRVQRDERWLLTDFLTPREQRLVASISSRDGLECAWYGGYSEAERLRCLLMPGDWQPQPDDFSIEVVHIRLTDDGQLSHGSVLGAVLGLGLDRRKIGDIQIEDKSAWVLVTSDVIRYLCDEWTQVGRYPMVAERLLEVNQVEWRAPVYEPETISVMSLRIDAVVAHACHWNREKAQQAVESGLVSLNHIEISKTDEAVQPGDVLSVRGFGRVKILSLLGQSKKQRERVLVGVLKSN